MKKRLLSALLALAMLISLLTMGASAATFAPDSPITREQMAAILYKYLITFYDVAPVSYDLSGFPDQGSISAYARPAIQFCVACALMSGEAKNGSVYISPQECHHPRPGCHCFLSRFPGFRRIIPFEIQDAYRKQRALSLSVKATSSLENASIFPNFPTLPQRTL